MKFRYELEKVSKKHQCPKCGKRTFVRFVDTETGEYLPIEFGRCDRENKCGYLANPQGEYSNSYEVEFTPPPPTSYHPIELIRQSGRNFKQNNFVQFLKTVFNEDEVKGAILNYLIGTSKLWNGATVFWQVDNLQRVRHGKIMLYNPTTGKRQKNGNGKSYINSVRSTLGLKDFNLNQCLFGLHLINETDTKTIAIVEGEKTAVIMSLFKPEYTWLATGSKLGFKYEMLKPLKGYKIIAFPDTSEYNDWRGKAMELNDIGFNITVSNLLENKGYEIGTDLADVFIDEVVDGKNRNSTHARARNPIEPQQSSVAILTKAERVAKRMIKINPFVKNLINEFELTDGNGFLIRTKN